MKGRQSDLYQRVLVALAASPSRGATIREIASALGTYDSSVRQALLRLVADGVAARSDGRYRVSRSRRAALELERARYDVGKEEFLRIASRISPAVTLAALDPKRGTLHLVLDRASEPSDALRFRETVGHVPDVQVREIPEVLTLGQTVEDIKARRSLRHELSRTRVLKGDVVSAIPTRAPGDPGKAKPLGRIHPTLAEPSRRTKQRLARDYGLDEISMFGSATRADFRPDSDVDVLVHFRGDAVPTLGSYASLTQDLSRALGRRVDVVDAENVEHAFIPSIQRDRVTLYGKPHALAAGEGARIRGAGDRRTRPTRRGLGRGPGEPSWPNAPR